MYQRKVLNFRVIFSCDAWWKIVWKMKITVHAASPQKLFSNLSRSKKVMFIVFEWKELGVYDVTGPSQSLKIREGL